MKYMEILLVLGKKCNFRCKYCYTQYLDDAYIDPINVFRDNLGKVIEHINWYLEETSLLRLSFYGGEPLVYADVIEKLVDKYRENPKVDFNLITNGLLLPQYWYIFEGIPRDRLAVAISYDYSMQEENRKEGTYEPVREVIKDAVGRLSKFKTITTFTADTLPIIKSVFEDHLKLVAECPREFRGRVNISKSTFKGRDDIYTNQKLIADLKEIREYNYFHPRGGWRSNSCMLSRKDTTRYLNFLPTCYAICPDGKITWDCRSYFYDGIDKLSAGTIFDSPEQVYKNRQDMLNLWGNHIDPECYKCGATSCKITPFRFYENESPVHWGQLPPLEDRHHCKITEFITKYLYV